MFQTKIIADPSSEPRRSEPRTTLEADVAMRALGSTAVEARLLNLSSRGFMAESAAFFTEGSRVWLTLPGGNRVNAEILWSRNGRVGGAFAEPIDPLQVIEAAGRLQPW
jgi:hypothetical protein